MKSIIQEKRECFLCGAVEDLQVHHCLRGVANRKLADKDGLTVYLCPLCHGNLHQRGWHDRDLKLMAEKAWIDNYGTQEDFIKRYGKSYQQ